MRFKAQFIQQGLQRLEKSLLPTLEKCGKSVQVLIGEDEINFIQAPVDTDGPCVCGRMQMDALFHHPSLKLSSKHKNLIAFRVDLPMLLRVLKSATSNAVDSLEVKLTQRTVNDAPKPFLNFSARGSNLALVHELPIGTPYTPAAVDALVADKEVAALSHWYLDVLPGISDVQAMVDRMKTISDTVQLSMAKNGDMYIGVAAINVELGLQLRGLQIFPTSTAPNTAGNRQLPIKRQLDNAIQAGDATTVDLPIKHLIRVLAVSTLSGQSQVLFGIGDPAQHLHVMFVYPDPSGNAIYDDSMAVSLKLPICES